MRLELHQLDRRYGHLRVCQPGRQRRLLASLAAAGQQTPIVVVALEGAAERYLVIDGYRRVEALERLGQDTVEAVLWPLGEAEALLADRAARWAGTESALEQGWLLAELVRRFGYEREELAQRFDRSLSWVSRRLALVELLPESVQQEVRQGRLTAQVAMKYLVPVARLSLQDCQGMAAVFARLGCTTRQAGQLYAAWRDGSPAARQRLLEAPELFFRAQQAEQDCASAPPAAPAEELARDLEIAAALLRRATRRLAGAALGPLAGAQCRALEEQVDGLRRQLDRLAERIPPEQDHVEAIPTHNDSGVTSTGREPPPDRPPAGDLAPDRAQGAALGFRPGTPHRAPREGPTLPRPHPGTASHLPGEPRASP